jgi:hypothetical protein
MSNRNILICVVLILAAIGVTWWFYGLGPLVVVLALSALICPAIVIWVMRKQRPLYPPPGTPPHAGHQSSGPLK